MSLLELNEIEMIYGKGESAIHALNGINLKIEYGEFVAIVGKSGCGKSTLLNIIGTITKPQKGDYFFDNIHINQLKRSELAKIRNKKIGFVVQHFALIEEMTVEDNIKLPLIYQSCHKKEIKERIKNVLDLLDISDKINRYPYELSGGQRQRTAIARAIITNPDIILADEPTGSLDEETGKTIINIFKELNKKGTTIIMVTHDMDIANSCNRKIHMKDGKII